MSARHRTLPNAQNVFPASTPHSRATLRAGRARDYPISDPRLVTIRDTINRRLHGAAVSIPSDTRDGLVLDMARVALRWSRVEIDARHSATLSDIREPSGIVSQRFEPRPGANTRRH